MSAGYIAQKPGGRDFLEVGAGLRNNIGSFIYKLELMVHTETPYEGSCQDTLADGDKTVELHSSKKV